MISKQIRVFNLYVIKQFVFFVVCINGVVHIIKWERVRVTETLKNENSGVSSHSMLIYFYGFLPVVNPFPNDKVFVILSRADCFEFILICF